MQDSENDLKLSLSIVFPAYEEEKKIEHDILRASKFIEDNDIDGDIIVVDDGSRDNTFDIAIKIKDRIPTELSILRHDSNMGKGFAVKSGIAHASKELILYSDVGDIVPFEKIYDGIELLNEKGANIAHGSRKLPDSVITNPQDTDRKFASWIFNIFFKNYLNVPNYLTDTQCGFKLYKSNVAKKLFDKLELSGFLFEIEIILRAVAANYKILEFPLEWKCDRDSRINFWNTTPNVLKEIFQLKKMFS